MYMINIMSEGPAISSTISIDADYSDLQVLAIGAKVLQNKVQLLEKII